MLQIEQTDPETGCRTVGADKHPARYAQYRTALQEHFLLRFLALVLFLDRAKALPLIPANPLLFNKVRVVPPFIGPPEAENNADPSGIRDSPASA